MKARLTFLFFLGSLGFLSFCCIGVLDSALFTQTDQGCRVPPRDYSQADLIGTWESEGHQDTLIIRADGKYKQIIHLEYNDKPDVDFESDWQSWWVEENSEDGISYLHLEGMSLCAAFPEMYDCENAVYIDKTWNNFCSHDQTGIQSNGDGILAVMGSPALTQPPRGISLFLVFSGEIPWAYELMEP